VPFERSDEANIHPLMASLCRGSWRVPKVFADKYADLSVSSQLPCTTECAFHECVPACREGSDQSWPPLIDGCQSFTYDLIFGDVSLSSATATSAPGLGSPSPHLRRDWAHPATSGLGSPQATSAPGPSGLFRYDLVFGDVAQQRLAFITKGVSKLKVGWHLFVLRGTLSPISRSALPRSCRSQAVVFLQSHHKQSH
jgi:hypothetical protein